MPVFSFHRHLLSGIRRLAVPGDGSRFWIGQFMVITSTVLGVYLAANAGFERAVEFDAMINKRSAYHLLNALESELKDNMAVNKRLTNNLINGRGSRELFLRRDKMGFFVWEAMKETDKTFMVPAEVITGVRRYYKAVANLREELDQSKIAVSYFKKRIDEEHAVLDKNVIPMILVEKENIRSMLESLGADVPADV